MKPVKPVLIIGVGNILCRDDGVGVHVAGFLLARHADADERIEIMDGGTAGPDLISYMRGRRKIVIMDALDESNSAGTVRLLKPHERLNGATPFSAHGASYGDCLNALRLLGETPEVVVIGIGASDMRAGALEPTLRVKAAIPDAAKLALKAAGS
jgi:hydrogenase maturation protease